MEKLNTINWLGIVQSLSDISPMGAVVLISVLAITASCFALFVVLRVIQEVKK